MIPFQLPTVLDVGCGDGLLGMKYKEQNPNSLFCGIELFQPAAEVASKRLDRVIAGDAEHIDLAKFKVSSDAFV